MSKETRTAFDFYVAVEPTPRERGAFRDAVGIAKDLGVKFQAGEVEIRWWRRESREPFGFVDRTGPKPFHVWLGTGGDVEQIVSTTAHELRHARDRLDGRDAETLDNNEHYESEARAKAFAARVLARWRAERRPRPITPQPDVSTPAIERSPRMTTTSLPLDIATLPQLSARAAHRVDRVKLERRRRVAPSRRYSWQPHVMMSDAALVHYTEAIAVLDEILAADDMEPTEAQPLLDFKNKLTARLESFDRDVT